MTAARSPAAQQCPAPPPGSPITNSYPFGTPKAVASEEGSTEDLVFGAHGAGVIAFRHTAGGGLQLLDPSPAQTGHLRANGVVRDTIPLADRIYAAAATQGVVSYERPSLVQGPSLTPLPFEDIWAIDVIEVGSIDVVIAGSNAGDICGSLYVFSVSGSTWYQPWVLHLGSPIYSIEAVKDLFSGKITIFVGTGCDGIQVYNIPSDLSSFPGNALATFVDNAGVFRDLAYQAGTLSPAHRLYAAAYNGGVRAFRLVLGLNPDSLSFDEQVNASWPVMPSTSSSTHFAWGVSVDDNRLAMGFGPKIDKQYIGDCDTGYPCVLPPARGAGQVGVVVRDVTSLAAPVPIGARLVDAGDPGGNYDVALRSKSSTLYFVDMAGTAGVGTATLKGELAAAWTLVLPADPTSQFGLAQGQPLPSNNAMYIQDSVLNSPTEASTSVFNLNLSGTDLLKNPSAVVVYPDALNPRKIQCLTGFPASVSPGRMYGLTDDAFVIYDTSNPTLPVATGVVAKVGTGLLGRTMLGISTESPIVPFRWLAAALEKKTGSSAGALQFFDVGYGTDPSGVLPVWTYQDESLALKFADVVARPIDPTSAWIYASYLRSYLDGSVQKYEAGLFRMKMTATGSVPAFTFTDIHMVPAVADTGGPTPWRITLDTELGTLYQGLGCFGWAVYDDPSPATGAPTLRYVKSATSWADPTKSVIVFEVLRGYFSGETNTWVLYVSCLNQGPAVWTNYASPTQGVLLVHRNRLQSIGIVVDPSDDTRRTLYGSDSQAGVNRLYFDPVLYP